MTLGERVEKRRKAARLSQDQLAADAHITQGLLSRIERDKTTDPGAKVLKGLALALGCSIDYLVGLYDDADTEERQSATASA